MCNVVFKSAAIIVAISALILGALPSRGFSASDTVELRKALVQNACSRDPDFRELYRSVKKRNWTVNRFAASERERLETLSETAEKVRHWRWGLEASYWGGAALLWIPYSVMTTVGAVAKKVLLTYLSYGVVRVISEKSLVESKKDFSPVASPSAAAAVVPTRKHVVARVAARLQKFERAHQELTRDFESHMAQFPEGLAAGFNNAVSFGAEEAKLMDTMLKESIARFSLYEQETKYTAAALEALEDMCLHPRLDSRTYGYLF